MGKHEMAPPLRAASMFPTSPFALMTPSASPPVQRRHASAAPSPTKKRRVSRASSVTTQSLRSYSIASASSSSANNFDASVEPGEEELHNARTARTSRILDIWSQLAEKYAKRLDEDDIIDLRKETIIKDRGVLRSSGNMFQFGYFAEEREKAERLDNGLPLVPADDEPDELDAFTDTPDNISRSETDVDDDEGLTLAQRARPLPPVRELDPADAADLADFLKAEADRRENFGDPDDEGQEEEDEGGEGGEVTRASDEEGGAFETDAQTEDSSNGDDFDNESAVSNYGPEEDATEGHARDDVHWEDVHDASGDESSHNDCSRLPMTSGSPEFDILELSNTEGASSAGRTMAAGRPNEDRLTSEPSTADSDDELGGWDCDEGSVLYAVDTSRAASDGIDQPASGSTSSTLSKVPGKRGGSSNAASKKTQEVRQLSRTPARQKLPVAWSPPPAVVQLQTPPRSTSFGPEPRHSKPKSTYSKKRRGSTSSAKKTPMRIQSTESLKSYSETEQSPLNNSRQKERSPSFPSPSKKTKSIPEVYIDTPCPGRVKDPREKAPSKENRQLTSSSKHGKFSNLASRAQLRGKAREAEPLDPSSFVDMDAGTKSPSPSFEIVEARSRPRSGRNNKVVRSVSPKKTFSSAKRRSRSPTPDGAFEMESTVDVVMAGPTQSPFRSASRRASSCRRSVIREISPVEPGPSSRPSRTRRSHIRPSGDHSYEGNPSSYLAPELSSFSFAPSFTHSAGFPTYPASHLSPHVQHQGVMQGPNLHNPNAQYHLAQALQSLSVLMGGIPPYLHSPLNAPHTPQHGPQPWHLHTPRHHNAAMTFDTPQSTATAPPSSPLGSDYSDNIPSSPTKQISQGRGRRHSRSHSSPFRPKSAIRDSSTPSRGRSHSLRRVSFSSPEATQIEDNAYEYASENDVEVASYDEERVIERGRQLHEERSMRPLQPQTPRRHVKRAQTPGPPDRVRGSQSGPPSLVDTSGSKPVRPAETPTKRRRGRR